MQANTANRLPTAVLEHGYAAPRRGKITSRGHKIGLTDTMRAMSVGTSFVIDDPRNSNTVYATASRLGIKVTTEKTQDGLRVHRIA